MVRKQAALISGNGLGLGCLCPFVAGLGLLELLAQGRATDFVGLLAVPDKAVGNGFLENPLLFESHHKAPRVFPVFDASD
jgi:hypothetical protein